MEVHVSSAEGFHKCPRAWYVTDRYSGLRLQPRIKSAALQFGSLVHEALENYYYHGMRIQDAWRDVCSKEVRRQREATGEFWPQEKETLEKQILVGAHVLEGYIEWMAESTDDPYNDAKLRYLDVEREFHIPMPNGVSLGGRWDGIVELRETGDLYVVEHKTAKDVMSTIDSVMFDAQPQFYSWAVPHVVGRPVMGILYNVMQSSDPYDVPILQNGLPSKAVRSNVKTSYGAYLSLLKQRAEDIGKSFVEVLGKYAEELEYLRTQAPPAYLRRLVIVSDAMKDATASQMMRDAEDMARTLTDVEKGVLPQPYKNRFTCPRCVARNVCVAMDEGANWQAVADVELVRCQEPPLFNEAE